MDNKDWHSVFDDVYPAAGATEAELRECVATIFKPVSAEEASELEAEQFDLDPTGWRFPQHPLPASFLDLLRWSNGGGAVNGDREFGFFPCLGGQHGLRAMLLAYHVPEYMPLAVPFAFNGGGTFYLFDMRKPPVDGEYPIICCGSGALGFDDDEYVLVGNTLLEACSGRVDVDSIRFPCPNFIEVKLTLIKPLPLKQLAILNKLFNLCDSVGQLRERYSEPPVLLTETGLDLARSVLANHPDLLASLEARDTENSDVAYSLGET